MHERGLDISRGLVTIMFRVLMSIDPYQTWRRLSQNEGGDQ